MLDNVLLLFRQLMFLQQDGDFVHNSIIVNDHLNNVFGSQWMGTYELVEWLLRSHDLNPLDFFIRPIENGSLC